MESRPLVWKAATRPAGERPYARMLEFIGTQHRGLIWHGRVHDLEAGMADGLKLVVMPVFPVRIDT
jgi:hypothetical protein